VREGAEDARSGDVLVRKSDAEEELRDAEGDGEDARREEHGDDAPEIPEVFRRDEGEESDRKQTEDTEEVLRGRLRRYRVGEREKSPEEDDAEGDGERKRPQPVPFGNDECGSDERDGDAERLREADRDIEQGNRNVLRREVERHPGENEREEECGFRVHMFFVIILPVATSYFTLSFRVHPRRINSARNLVSFSPIHLHHQTSLCHSRMPVLA
jgi:hypothetical protein